MNVPEEVQEEPPLPDVDASVPYLQLVRYSCSGLIAGGAGVALAMLVTAAKIYPESFVALLTVYFVLFAAALFGMRMAVGKIRSPEIRARRLLIPIICVLIAVVLFLCLFAPPRANQPFSPIWWTIAGFSLLATAGGATMRAMVEHTLDALADD